MKTNLLIVLQVIFVSGILSISAGAQDDPPADAASKQAAKRRATSESTAQGQSDELSAIRAGSAAFVAAFNKGDAKAVAALWTADGEFIDESGRRLQGSGEIEQEYVAFFADHQGVKIRIIVDSLRLLSDSVAIEDGRAMLDPVPAGSPATTKYMAIHVKADGKWRMSSVRDSRVESPSTYRNVADLEWLIGTWVAEEHGSITQSICRWVANKCFVERSYTVTKPDHTTTSGVQLIGWNPQAGHVQSWNFSADGGHAIGIWTPREQGWSAEIRGVSGDGTTTTAVNLLTRLDDNAYTWQSVQRTAGEQALPDTDEVVLKRIVKGR